MNLLHKIADLPARKFFGLLILASLLLAIPTTIFLNKSITETTSQKGPLFSIASDACTNAGGTCFYGSTSCPVPGTQVALDPDSGCASTAVCCKVRAGGSACTNAGGTCTSGSCPGSGNQVALAPEDNCATGSICCRVGTGESACANVGGTCLGGNSCPVLGTQVALAPGDQCATGNVCCRDSGGGGGETPYTITSGMADRTDYPGGDFYSYVNPDPNLRTPQDCQIACQEDQNCQAWTWVKAGNPGSQNGQSTCYEKGSNHAKVCGTAPAGTVSGAKPTDPNRCGATSGGGGGGTTPANTSTPTPTSTTGGGNTQYSLAVTVNPTQVKPGDSITLCYTLTPQNIPFHVRLLSSLGGGLSLVNEWDDNGAGGGDCIPVNISAQVQSGTRQLKVEAIINGSKVAEKTVTIIITGTITPPTATVTTKPPTATNTVSPTQGNQPTATNTIAPTQGQPTATPTTAQATATPTTGQPTATPTLAPNASRIFVIIKIDGVGTNGSAGENTAPVRPAQLLAVQIINGQGNVVRDTAGIINYDPVSGLFKGTISIGDITSGAYNVRLRMFNSLWKATTAFITAGTTTNIPQIKIITGDIIHNNILNLYDYTAMLACINPTAWDPQDWCDRNQMRDNADLNIDGRVDEPDLNILLSHFATRQGD